MSIVINNLQKLVCISKTQLIFDTRLLLKITGYNSFDLGVILTTDNEIQDLNRLYRGVNQVTDILAFPFHEISEDNAGIIPDVPQEEKMLGDIVLGVSYIFNESQKYGTHFSSDLLTHITHGIFHLVGYDHETKQQWSRMFAREMETLQKFNSLTGYRCFPLLGIGHEICR